LSRASSSLQSFEAADYFAVNVLSDDQIAVAEQFAKKGARDPFSDLQIFEGIGGTPILDGCAVTFQCRKYQTYGAGDHIIFVGEVLDMCETGKPGLVFHYGAYAVSQPHPAVQQSSAEAFYFSAF